MEIQFEKLPSPAQTAPEVETPLAAGATFAEARLNYLKMMTMTLLNELNSLAQAHREPAGRRVDLKTEVLRFESEVIRSALHTTRGQQRRAARLLGTNATTLNTKLKRLKIGLDNDDDFALDSPGETGFSDSVDQPPTFAEAVDRYEARLIQNALMHAGGNQSKAARRLQLPITTLNSKIKKLRIDVSKYSMNLNAELPSPGGFVAKVGEADD